MKFFNFIYFSSNWKFKPGIAEFSSQIIFLNITIRIIIKQINSNIFQIMEDNFIKCEIFHRIVFFIKLRHLCVEFRQIIVASKIAIFISIRTRITNLFNNFRKIDLQWPDFKNKLKETKENIEKRWREFQSYSRKKCGNIWNIWKTRKKNKKSEATDKTIYR